ncbi:hypothetical protein GOBAR_DD32912 [Gossypium barbadense]|nr:hypothetical protein GOBAR_DD32912 [Gossypium barbadense]
MEILKYKKPFCPLVAKIIRATKTLSVSYLTGQPFLTIQQLGRLNSKSILVAHKGRNGRAFLFSHAMNITLGPKEDRHLLSGLHTVADIYCADCHQVLGWKYERAYEVSQKYKEGKFILEKAKIVKEDW